MLNQFAWSWLFCGLSIHISHKRNSEGEEVVEVYTCNLQHFTHDLHMIHAKRGNYIFFACLISSTKDLRIRVLTYVKLLLELLTSKEKIDVASMVPNNNLIFSK